MGTVFYIYGVSDSVRILEMPAIDLGLTIPELTLDQPRTLEMPAIDLGLIVVGPNQVVRPGPIGLNLLPVAPNIIANEIHVSPEPIRLTLTPIAPFPRQDYTGTPAPINLGLTVIAPTIESTHVRPPPINLNLTLPAFVVYDPLQKWCVEEAVIYTSLAEGNVYQTVIGYIPCG